MTLTKKDLICIEKSMRLAFTSEEERIILEIFGSEPDGHEWSHQDIHEQIRKICNRKAL